MDVIEHGVDIDVGEVGALEPVQVVHKGREQGVEATDGVIYDLHTRCPVVAEPRQCARRATHWPYPEDRHLPRAFLVQRLHLVAITVNYLSFSFEPQKNYRSHVSLDPTAALMHKSHNLS